MEKVTDIVDSGGGGAEVLSSLPESLDFDLDVQKEKPSDLGMIDSDILEFANQVGEEMDTTTDEANIASELSFLEGAEEKETGAIDVRDDPGLAFLVGESTKVEMNGEDLEFLEQQDLGDSDYEDYEEDSEDDEESDEDDDDESEDEEEGDDGEEKMEECEDIKKEIDIKTEDDDGDFGQVSFYDAEPDSKSSMDDLKMPKKKTEKGKKRKGKKRKVVEGDGVTKAPKKKRRKVKKKKKTEGEAGEEEEGDENVPKAGTRRRNIRSILSEKDLDKDMLSAQQEELERQKRLMELKQSRLKESAAAVAASTVTATSSTCTQATEMKSASASADIPSPKEKDSQLKSLLQVAEEEAEKEAESKDRKQIEKEVIKIKKETRETSPPSDVITLSSDSDESDDADEDSDGVLVVPSDEDEEYEEDNEDLNNGGSHIDDNLNLPDSDGRVKINIGHPSDDPDVYLAPQIAQAIKPHQIGGVRFLYDNLVESLERFRTSPGFGCILAHSMGLGKTIQLISFIDIFIRCTGGKTVLCIVPINTLQNWLAEFNYWLPDKEKLLPDDDLTQFRVFPLYLINDSMKTTATRAAVVAKWKTTGGALIIGYEMFRLLSSKKVAPSKKTKSRAKKNSDAPEVIDVEEEDKNKVLMNDMHSAMVDPGPDLVMCDEGHRIKNSSAAISQALKNIKTKRRVVLTGYPLQNNLMEYWCMVDFVRPSFLGTKTEFSNMFERPIMNGQCVDSTAQDKKVMRHRSYVLHNLLEGFVQRRGHTVLQVNLPKKSEHVFLVRLSPIQRKIYCEFMNAISESGLCSWANNNPLKAFAVCCKIWNHPDVLHDVLTQRNLDKDNDLDIDTGENMNSKKKAGGAKSRTAARSKALQQQQQQQLQQQQMQQPLQQQQHMQQPLHPQQQMQPFQQQQMQQQALQSPHLQQLQQPLQQQPMSQPPLPQPLMSSAMTSAMANYPPIAPTPSAPGLPPPPPPPPPPQLPPPQSLPASLSSSTSSSSTATSTDPPTPLTPSSSTTSLTSMASETSSEKNPVTYDWAEGLMKDYVAGVIENSGKMVLMKDIIEECLAVGDKVLVFSQSLLTLNKIEEFMGRCPVPRPELCENWIKNRTYFRLDGSTSALDREKLINQFNDPEGIAWMFLLSTKAGCLGINLIGANRVIVVDASWNPCHDCQAVCRVYRFGQVKNTYVYRLVTDNTLEKRIYDRQISKQGMSDRIIDDMNVENKFTRRQVENLLDFEDQDFPIQDFSNAETKYSQDQVLVRVLHNNGKWLTKQPFTHESLLIDRKEMRLSKREKRLAKEGYARDKRMNVSYTRPSYAAYYPQHGGLPNRLPLNSRYNYAAFRRGPIVRPIASVRPIIAASAQSGAEKIKQFGGQPLRPGVTIHQVITTTEIVLPGTNTGTQAGAATSNKIAAGQKILVIKTPKGVYIRTNDGKMFAVRSKTPGIGGLDSMASSGSAITTTTLSSTGGQVILSSGINATTVAAAAAGGKKPPIIIVSNKKGMPISMTRGGSIIRTLPYGSADLLSSLRSNISLIKAKSAVGSESTSTTSSTSMKSSTSVKKGSTLAELIADDDDDSATKDDDNKDDQNKGDGNQEKKTSDGSTQSITMPKMPVIVLPSLGVRTPRPPSKQPPPSSTHAVQSGSTVVIMPTKPVVSMGTRRPPKNPKKKPNKSISSDKSFNFDLTSNFDNDDASKKKGMFSLLPPNSNVSNNNSVSVGTDGNNSSSSSVGVGGDGSSTTGDHSSTSSSMGSQMNGGNSQTSDNSMGGLSVQPQNPGLVGQPGGHMAQQQQQPSSGSNEGFPDLNRMWQANFGTAPQQQQQQPPHQQHLPQAQQQPMGGSGGHLPSSNAMSHGGPMAMGNNPMQPSSSASSYLGGNNNSNNTNSGMFGGVGNPNQQQPGGMAPMSGDTNNPTGTGSSNNAATANQNSALQSNVNNANNSISNNNNPNNNMNFPGGFNSSQGFNNSNSSNNNGGNNSSGNNSATGNNSIPPNNFQQQPNTMFGSGGGGGVMGSPMMPSMGGHSQPYNMAMMANFMPSFNHSMAPHMAPSALHNNQSQPTGNNPMMFGGPQNNPTTGPFNQQQYAVNNQQQQNPNPNPSPTNNQQFGNSNMGSQMNNPTFQQPGAPAVTNQQSPFGFPPVSNYGGGLVPQPSNPQPPPFMPHNQQQQQSMMGGPGDPHAFSSLPTTSSASNTTNPPYNNPPQHTGFGIDQLTNNSNTNQSHFPQNQQTFLQQQNSNQQLQTPSRPASNSNSTPSSTPTLSVPAYPENTNRTSSTATPDSSKRDNSPYSLTVLGGTDSSKVVTTESSQTTSKSKRNKSSSKSKSSNNSASSLSSSSSSSSNLDNNKNTKNSNSATSLTIPNFSSSSSPLNNSLLSMDNSKPQPNMSNLNNTSMQPTSNSLNIPSLPAFRPFSSSPMGDLSSPSLLSASTSSLSSSQSLPQQSQPFANDSVIGSGSAFRAHTGSASASGIPSSSSSSSSFVNPQPFRLNGAGGISAALGMGAGATPPTLNYNTGMSAFSSPGTGIGGAAAVAAAAAYGAAATHNAFGAYGSGYANPGALPFSSTPMMSPQAAMMGYPQPSLGYPGMSSLMMGAPSPAAPSAMGGSMWPMMPPSMMGGAYGYAPAPAPPPHGPGMGFSTHGLDGQGFGS